MIHYAITDSDGYLVAHGSGQVAPNGAVILDSALTHPVIPRGYKYHLASSTLVDVRSLDEVKAAQWEKVKASRYRAEASGFLWDGSLFDSDKISQQRITAAAQIASLNPEFSVDWTLADNSVRSLSASDMLAVCAAMGAHLNQQHATGRNLRAQIDSATNTAGVESVCWP